VIVVTVLLSPLGGLLSFLIQSERGSVLAWFSLFGYRPAMPDDQKLTPATRRDVETCLSLGLTGGSSLARNQAAEVRAKVVAERLVAHLERSGFVNMRKPIPTGSAGDNPGARTPGR
jgi:hypothetical protein